MNSDGWPLISLERVLHEMLAPDVLRCIDEIEIRIKMVPEARLMGVEGVVDSKKISLTNSDLLQLLMRHFNGNEFKRLLFDLNISDEKFTGSVHEKMRDVVAYVERHGQREALIGAIKVARPALFGGG